MSTRFEKFWTESGRGDGQGDVEKKDHQSYRRPYMMGKARGKKGEKAFHSRPYAKRNRNTDFAHQVFINIL